jgi:eukaryotic-like serine/threonine-protein kinase
MGIFCYQFILHFVIRNGCPMNLEQFTQLIDDLGLEVDLRSTLLKRYETRVKQLALIGKDKFMKNPISLSEPNIASGIGLGSGKDTLDLTLDENQPLPKTMDDLVSKVGEYDDLGQLGKGGMGEVRLIRDRKLNRRLAMKIIHPELLQRSSVIARFIEEAQICAQLQHPNIVPVHELGALPDGRFYFTMKEVKGQSFETVIESVHSSIRNNQFQITQDGWSFRQLIDVFYQVCQALSYAHSMGVLHRDLKPENIMLGEFGEVLVVDWGIAKILGRVDASFDNVSTHRSKAGAYATKLGQVAGTPAYMSPEQARGEVDKIDIRSDIYSLGAILYEILKGVPPYQGDTSKEILDKVLNGPHTSFSSKRRTPSHLPVLPEELVAACEKAMSRELEQRYNSVHELIEVVLDWLEGARKREKALSIVDQALALNNTKQRLKSEITSLEKDIEIAKERSSIRDDELKKIPIWNKENEMKEKKEQLRRIDVEQEKLLQASLTHKADLYEAHESLIQRYRELHWKAESNFHYSLAERYEQLIRWHLNSLPSTSKQIQEISKYLDGVGKVSLATEQPAAVWMAKYKEVNRRLVLGEEHYIGDTPLTTEIPMGRYRVRFVSEGYNDAIYPINIDRLQYWDGQAPDEVECHPLPLIPNEELLDNECYIPAGWCWVGGDNSAGVGMEAMRTWIDGYIIKKYPVTVGEYLVFLNDLVENDQQEMAGKFEPRERSGNMGERIGQPLFGKDHRGTYFLQPDSDGDMWQLDWPILMIDHHSAVGYAKWYSKRTGKLWRLPYELEWEKAARGTDRRFFLGEIILTTRGQMCMVLLKRVTHPQYMILRLMNHRMVSVG